MKYEYEVISVRVKKYTLQFIAYLNEMGTKGWALVSAESLIGDDWTDFIWMREITGESNAGEH